MLRKSLEIEAKCPMCNEDLDPSQVEEVDPTEVLQKIKIKSSTEEKKDKKPDDS